MKNKTVKLMAVFMAVAMAMTACGDSGGVSKKTFPEKKPPCASAPPPRASCLPRPVE